MSGDRRLPHDWHDGTVPPAVDLDPTAYVETSYSFLLFRSRKRVGLRIGRGASVYKGTMFDVGPEGEVTIGTFAMLHGVRLICDARVEIGDFTVMSWNVVLADNFRIPDERDDRRRLLESVAAAPARRPQAPVSPRPTRLGANVWIGHDAVVMPGVVVGDGSIVGARSVVCGDVPPFSVAVGNPARVVRRLDPEPRA